MKPKAAGFWAADGSGKVSETLQTRRLTLRPMRPEDATELHDFFSDPAATLYFGDTHHDVAQTKDWVRRSSHANPTLTREFTLLHKGRAIGKAGVWSAPELGFFLRRADWGKGLMHEALTALIPHLFAEMQLPRMTADVDPRNAASLKLLEAFGFVESDRAERTMQIEGVWVDSVYLTLPAPPR